MVLAETRAADRNTPDNMKKVKITILKTMLNEDLAKEYGICGLKACPMMKVGDVFYADYAKPEGFCDEAWKAVGLLPPAGALHNRCLLYFWLEAAADSRWTTGRGAWCISGFLSVWAI